jgi:hypothetical protein
MVRFKIMGAGHTAFDPGMSRVRAREPRPLADDGAKTGNVNPRESALLGFTEPLGLAGNVH